MNRRKILSAVTITLVPESRGGPFVFCDDLEHGCTQAAALGFDAVEIFPPAPETLKPRELRRLLKRHKLRLAAVGTGAGWVKHRLTLTNPDPAIRMKAHEFIAGIVALSADFGAPTIVGSMQGRVGDGVTRRQALQWLAESLNALGKQAHRQGGSLLYEPLNRYEQNLFNRAGDAAAFLTRRKIRHVKLLCDLFHMNIEEVSIPATLRAVARHVGHIHYVDTNRLAVGFGHLDAVSIVKTLREIGYEGYLSAEALPLPNPEAAARQAMRAFRQLVTED